MIDEEPFPGSPDDMMNTIASLRARVAKLEEALSETLRIYGRWLDGTFRERISELIGVPPPKPDNDGPKANLRTPWIAPK